MPAQILVLAGVNGAGKSSVLGGPILRDHGIDWFNPDSYARQLAADLGVSLQEANARAWRFGKEALESAIAKRTNYAFETTLGGNTITALLARAARTHEVSMLYCGLASPELHMARVALRVANDGHPITEKKIRERWESSPLNLVKLLPALANLQLFDNSRQAQPGDEIADPVLVLHMHGGSLVAPDPSDVAALKAIPAWARPVVEAAVQLDARPKVTSPDPPALA